MKAGSFCLHTCTLAPAVVFLRRCQGRGGEAPAVVPSMSVRASASACPQAPPARVGTFPKARGPSTLRRSSVLLHRRPKSSPPGGENGRTDVQNISLLEAQGWKISKTNRAGLCFQPFLYLAWRSVCGNSLPLGLRVRSSGRWQ